MAKLDHTELIPVFNDLAKTRASMEAILKSVAGLLSNAEDADEAAEVAAAERLYRRLHVSPDGSIPDHVHSDPLHTKLGPGPSQDAFMEGLGMNDASALGRLIAAATSEFRRVVPLIDVITAMHTQMTLETRCPKCDDWTYHQIKLFDDPQAGFLMVCKDCGTGNVAIQVREGFIPDSLEQEPST